MRLTGICLSSSLRLHQMQRSKAWSLGSEEAMRLCGALVN
jgi:hypothetical protein